MELLSKEILDQIRAAKAAREAKAAEQAQPQTEKEEWIEDENYDPFRQESEFTTPPERGLFLASW